MATSPITPELIILRCETEAKFPGRNFFSRTFHLPVYRNYRLADTQTMQRGAAMQIIWPGFLQDQRKLVENLNRAEIKRGKAGFLNSTTC